MGATNSDQIVYGRTQKGQLLYDLAFAQLSDKWIARKHKMPVSEVRKCRAAAFKGLGGKPRKAKKKPALTKKEAK